MIAYNPSLILKRLIIKKSSNVVYDELFSTGVNIIVGENNSGKSTILEALIYLLDGDIKVKKEVFDICDVVYGEFLINQKVYTFKRLIAEDGVTPPIEICPMNYNDAIMQKDADFWMKYTHARNGARWSFSMAIFSLLGFPEEKSEEGSNITINDILRLIYQDQKTPADKIFREQEYNESAIKRQAVSDFLLGIDDYEIINLKQSLNKKQNAYNILEGEFNEIYRTLGSADFETNSKKLEERKLEIEEEVRLINDNLKYILENREISESKKHKLNEEISGIITLKKTLSDITDENKSIQYEIDDYNSFLDSIQSRIKSLILAQKTSNFCQIEFEFCPQCFKKIDNSSVDSSSHCTLCKSEITSNNINHNYLKMHNELEFQKKEIQEILELKEKRINETELLISEYKTKLFVVEQKRRDFINSCTVVDAEFKSNFRRLGYLDKSLLEIEELKKLASKIDIIKNKKAKLAEEISSYQELIINAQKSREAKRQEVYSKIEEKTLELIQEDKTKELQTTTIWFDFSTNKLLSEKKKSLAASTGTYLKNAFFFSMFLTSLELEYVRYPRFIILDNIDDSGLDRPRAQKFHNAVIEYSKKANISHQIIFTTRSEIASEELKKSEFVIGKEYWNEDGKRSFNIKLR